MFPLCATSNLSTFSNVSFSFTHTFFFSPLVPLPPSIPTNAFLLSPFLDPFSPSLYLFRFLIIHLLLSFPAPWGKQIPLSQARTINQSLVSHMFYLSQCFTSPLCTSLFCFHHPFYTWFCPSFMFLWSYLLPPVILSLHSSLILWTILSSSHCGSILPAPSAAFTDMRNDKNKVKILYLLSISVKNCSPKEMCK